MAQHQHHDICLKLVKMTPKLEDLKTRIEFLVLVITYGLGHELRNYALQDMGYDRLGARHFDACFEMDDNGATVAGLLARARADGFVDKLIADVGQAQYDEWCAKYEPQGTLF